uniref:Reverse transcriptase domain-containing protein n=1 Tax=Trichogramma kaykai TaxID=54128 RepID=A0ABD2X8G7_9HYME
MSEDDREELQQNTECPRITAFIESTPINALIDTGSKVTCLSEEFYESQVDTFKYNAKLPLTSIYMRGFTGEKSQRVKLQIRAQIRIGMRDIMMNFFVIPKLINPCIIGIEYLMEMKAFINLGEMQANFQIDGVENFVPFTLEKRAHEPIMLIHMPRDTDAKAPLDQTQQFITRDSNATGNQHTSSLLMIPDEKQLREKVEAVKNISNEKREKLFNLLYRYRSCFNEVPGRFKSFVYKLKVQDTSPYFAKSYPIPIAHHVAVSEEIARMLRYDIIERSYSRLDSDHDGPEEMEELQKKYTNIGIMTSVDLRTSFWQVPLHPQSRKYTAFTHAGKTYQFKVIPFGLKISSAALARTAEAVIQDLSDCVFDYVDDWLVISRDIDEHIEHLDRLFKAMENKQITANFDKLELCRSKIKYVGHVVTTNGMYPTLKK